MANKSSKANSPSWRTLVRRADKERSPRKAAALRKEAAAMRRSERKKPKASALVLRAGKSRSARSIGAKLGWLKRKAKGAKFSGVRQATVTGMLASQVSNVQVQNARNAMNQALYGDGQGKATPGHGEIVGGELSRKTDEIIKLARSKKNAPEAVQAQLAMIEATAKYVGASNCDERHMNAMRSIHETNATNVIGAFLARIEAAGRSNGGPLPKSLVVSGYELARVCDALRKAGYTEDGKR